MRFVQSHDYINALKELDWIEMLDRFQGRTVMNVIFVLLVDVRSTFVLIDCLIFIV